jgi:4-amino-4-deoxy-L-arabinose transferase-like glycosyltransferase
MVLAALALRLAAMAFLYPEHLNPARDHWEFAYETGRVAQSIAYGHGVGNPIFGNTGPTAMVMPAYPLILAGVFKLFGAYSKASALAILSLNCVFSSLTCIPVFFIARKHFGGQTARWAGWIWAFFPYGIYFSANWIWTTSLTTLLLTVLFWFVLHLEHSSSASEWIGFGVLSGLAALTDPVVLSVLPLLAGWAAYRLYQRKSRWRTSLALAGLSCVIVVSPWFVRNYLTFHQFIPFRDGLGLELYVGNNGYTAHWASTQIRLSNNPAEFAEYQHSGELAYMARKRQQAVAFISSHPGWFAWISLRRMVYMWTGFWSFDHDYLVKEPLDPPNVLFCTALTLLTLVGLVRAFREDYARTIPYALVLLCFPLVYYVTHPEVYYRRPIDPIFVILATYAVMPCPRQSQKPELQPADVELVEV